MPVDGNINWKVNINAQQTLNQMQRIIDKHSIEIQKLREKLRIARRTATVARTAGGAGGLFGGTATMFAGITRALPGIFSAAAIIGTMHRLMGEMSRMQIRAFESLQSQQGTLTALGQLTFGEPFGTGRALQAIARRQAVTQGIPLTRGQGFTFAGISRGLQQEEVGEFPALRFLQNKEFGLSLAADVQRQFGPSVPQGRGGILQILSAFLQAAKPTKATLEEVGGLIARPSQFARDIGVGLPESLAATGVAVAGVKNLDEASTQIRAFFQRLGDIPDLLRKVKDDGLVPLLRDLEALDDAARRKLFPDVRARAGGSILMRNIEAIAEAIPLVQKAMETGGLGGNMDAIQQQNREAMFDPNRQLPFLLQQAMAREEAANQVTGFGRREFVIRAAEAEQRAFFKMQEGDTFRNRGRMAILATRNAMLKAGGIGAVPFVQRLIDDVTGLGGARGPEADAFVRRMEDLLLNLKLPEPGSEVADNAAAWLTRVLTTIIQNEISGGWSFRRPLTRNPITGMVDLPVGGS
jgi:hypothetical protein